MLVVPPPPPARLFLAPLLVLALGLVLGGCDGAPGGTFFPLEAGRHWHYRVERTTMDGTRELRYAVSSLPATDFEGTRAAVRATVDGRRSFYREEADGIYRLGVLPTAAAGGRELVLPRPLAADSNWRARTTTSVLENTGPPWETLFRISVPVDLEYAVTALDATVTTPAGTFDDCLVVRGHGTASADVGNYIGRTDIEITSTEWFAPGVGLVRLERTERTGASALDHGRLLLELATWQGD